jgi:DNA-binding HxlR family transcriptional regulator
MKSKKVYIQAETLRNLMSHETKQVLHHLDSKDLTNEQLHKQTNISKDDLHHQLINLLNGNLIKKKHKQNTFYYSLTYKGSCLLHPENSRILLLYGLSLFSLTFSLAHVIHWIRQILQTSQETMVTPNTQLFFDESSSVLGTRTIEQTADPLITPIILIGFVLFVCLICMTIWRYQKNKNLAL